MNRTPLERRLGRYRRLRLAAMRDPLKPDLTFVGTQELLAELSKRYDAIGFIMGTREPALKRCAYVMHVEGMCVHTTRRVLLELARTLPDGPCPDGAHA